MKHISNKHYSFANFVTHLYTSHPTQVALSCHWQCWEVLAARRTKSLHKQNFTKLKSRLI